MVLVIFGNDGSRYERIGRDLYYEIGGRRGSIRNFNGELFDVNKLVGHLINGNIYLPDCSWIKKSGDTIFSNYMNYKLVEDKLSCADKIWFGVENDWDAMRIVLKDVYNYQHKLQRII